MRDPGDFSADAPDTATLAGLIWGHGSLSSWIALANPGMILTGNGKTAALQAKHHPRSLHSLCGTTALAAKRRAFPTSKVEKNPQLVLQGGFEPQGMDQITSAHNGLWTLLISFSRHQYSTLCLGHHPYFSAMHKPVRCICRVIQLSKAPSIHSSV